MWDGVAVSSAGLMGSTGYACDPRPHTRMKRRRQPGALLSSSTRSARLPHLAQRSRRSTVANVILGGRRDTGTTLAGHLPQSLTRVRQAQQPRQVTTSCQAARSATSDPSTIACNWRWPVLADMGASSISCLSGARAAADLYRQPPHARAYCCRKSCSRRDSTALSLARVGRFRRLKSGRLRWWGGWLRA